MSSDIPVTKSKYQLVIRIPIEEVDDMEARLVAKSFLEKMSVPPEAGVKFQKILTNGPPVKVEL